MAFPRLYNKKGGHNITGGKNSNRIARTRHLSRIIMYLIDSDDAETITQIKDGTGLTTSLEDALNWLHSNKIINKISSNDAVHLYFINQAWKELRDSK